MAEASSDKLFHRCAWCGNPIQDDDYYGFGAKASQDIDLEERAGQFVSLNLSLMKKTVIALVPSELGAPVLEGHDLFFITCSEECARDLKDALDLERDVFDDG